MKICFFPCLNNDTTTKKYNLYYDLIYDQVIWPVYTSPHNSQNPNWTGQKSWGVFHTNDFPKLTVNSPILALCCVTTEPRL